MKKLMILFMCGVFLFSWELKKDENSIKVYTQDVKDSKYDEFRAVMKIKAPFDKVKAVLLDFKNYPKWQKKIDKIAVSNGYMFKCLDFPFPLSNRHAYYKMNIKNASDEINVSIKSVPYKNLPDEIKKSLPKPCGVEMKDTAFIYAKKIPEGTEVVGSCLSGES